MVRTEAYSTVFLKYIFYFIVIPTFKPAYIFHRPTQTRTEYFIKHSQSKYI